MDYSRGYLNDDNKLYLVILGKSRFIKNYENLRNIGAKYIKQMTRGIMVR